MIIIIGSTYVHGVIISTFIITNGNLENGQRKKSELYNDIEIDKKKTKLEVPGIIVSFSLKTYPAVGVCLCCSVDVH